MPLDIPDIIITRPIPANYILDAALEKAVEVALAFNQPLLLTGEPGTGKTLLAYKIAHVLHKKTKANPRSKPFFGATPLRFNTKTTSSARDLFYTYDTIGHFQQANIKQDHQETKSTKDYIELQALGKAIALATPEENYKEKFNWEMPSRALSSVVLVDEIDKAPRDFTNDILNEIEDAQFFIKEQNNFSIKKEAQNPQRILIIMTSNSEKNLPDAFLRRCIFYHIEFPKAEKLQQILKAQLDEKTNQTIETNLAAITQLFYDIRAAAVRKKPATAELVALVKLLEMDGLLGNEQPNYHQWFIQNLSLLAKTKDDIDAFKQFLDNQASANSTNA